MSNPNSYWVRQYRCYNPECCDGDWPTQVTHTTDIKQEHCGWCGEPWTYERDVVIVPKDSDAETN